METRAVLETIERHLSAPLSADWLAKEAGYSTWHFLRMFTAKMQMPLGEYILDRRLKTVLYHISQGEKAVDAALEYGFDTYAGFYKAFVRTYGCSPRKYRQLYGAKLDKPILTEALKSNMTHLQIKALLAKHYALNEEPTVIDIPIMNSRKISDSAWHIGEKHTLKRSKNPRVFQKNIHIAKALSSQKLQGALPIKTLYDEDFFCEDETFFMLAKRIPGRPLYQEECFGYAEGYGQALARLHKALQALDKVIPCDDRNIYQEVIEYALPRAMKQAAQWQMKLPESFFQELQDSLPILQEIPVQIIHRDPNPDNILFENGHFTGFVDFDLSQRSIRLFDVCYLTTGVLSEIILDNAKLDKWLAFFKAVLLFYNNDNPLTEKEKQAVFETLCAIELICIAYFGEIDTPDMKYLAQINRQMFEFIVANRAFIENIF